MSLFKKKTSRFWFVQLYSRDSYNRSIRIVRSTGKESKAEALQVEAVLKEALGKKTARDRIYEVVDRIYAVDRVEVDLSFEQVWNFYLIEIKRRVLNKKLISDKLSVWLKFEEWCKKCAVIDFRKVTRQLAIGYIDFLCDSDRRGKTINVIRGNLSSIVNAVMARANLHENVFTFTKSSSELDSITGRAFSVDEVDVLLSKCEQEGNDFFGFGLLLLYTGLRVIDAVNIRFCDINDDGILTVIPRKTKRYKIAVKIPLHCNFLSWLDLQKYDGDDFIFARILRLYKSNSSWKRIRDRVFAEVKNPDYKIGWHCFRHTFRTMISGVGGGIDVAKKLLGHSSDMMSLKYDHDVSQLKSVIDKL